LTSSVPTTREPEPWLSRNPAPLFCPPWPTRRRSWPSAAAAIRQPGQLRTLHRPLCCPPA
jgi:hypothetical protein